MHLIHDNLYWSGYLHSNVISYAQLKVHIYVPGSREYSNHMNLVFFLEKIFQVIDMILLQHEYLVLWYIIYTYDIRAHNSGCRMYVCMYRLIKELREVVKCTLYMPILIFTQRL